MCIGITVQILHPSAVYAPGRGGYTASMADIRRPYALQTAKSDKAPHSKTG